MSVLDLLIESFESHCVKLGNRLDAAYMDIELKDYTSAMLAWRQCLGSLIDMRKETQDASAGSIVRGYESAFKDAASRGKTDSGPTVVHGDPDHPTALHYDWPGRQSGIESNRADAGDDGNTSGHTHGAVPD